MSDLDAFLERFDRNFLRSDDDEEIPMVCTRCGYEEPVPRWLLGEAAEMHASAGGEGRDVGMTCPECGGFMKRKDD